MWYMLEEWGQLRSKRYICPYFFWVESQPWHFIVLRVLSYFNGGRGDGFRLMYKEIVFQRQSWLYKIYNAKDIVEAEELQNY